MASAQILSRAGIDEHAPSGGGDQRDGHVAGTVRHGLDSATGIGQTRIVWHSGTVPDFGALHGAGAGAEERRGPALQCQPRDGMKLTY